MTTLTLPFDLAAACTHLSARDEKLAELIQSTTQFQLDEILAESPYAALVESITHQSISGKAAVTIFARVKALSSTGGIPTPQEMLKLKKPALRKAGLSGAKILAMKDLAQ
jgi:3-methyladenine DNA glycosylase/8-oxoguanine DNA glycosylase